MHFRTVSKILMGMLCALPLSGFGESRIKDVAAFEGVRDNQLLGYGLVVGLNGSGDRSQTFFTTQTLANLLERSGITVSATQIRVKNTAAVMVTAALPPFARFGSRIDVTVSSIGDAQNLQGGILLMTPMKAPNNQVYVSAQGQVVLGGFSASSGQSTVQLNHPTVGRIPNGGLVEQTVPFEIAGKRQLTLVLYNSDFTTATRSMHAINETVGSTVAQAVDGRTISIEVPSNYLGRTVEFMALVENARAEVDIRAKVVVNEKTGTIILGKDVRIGKISIIQGSLSLQVGTAFAVSQPAPFSEGETTVVPETTISVQEEAPSTVTLKEGASVEEVVQALNSIGAGPRDIIAILIALKKHGALQADLEVI